MFIAEQLKKLSYEMKIVSHNKWRNKENVYTYTMQPYSPMKKSEILLFAAK
jgi:hypothetical protein